MENIPIILSAKAKSFDSSQIDNLDLSSNDDEKKKKGTFMTNLLSFKTRHILTIYAFFGFFFAYSFRAQLSVAIVEMSKANRLNKSHNGTFVVEGDWSPVLQVINFLTQLICYLL